MNVESLPLICHYCGGNCPNDETGLYLCDGYASDWDDLYKEEEEDV